MPTRRNVVSQWAPGHHWNTTQWCTSPEPANSPMVGYSYTEGELITSQSNDYKSLGKVDYGIGGDFAANKREYFSGSPLGQGRVHLSRYDTPNRCEAPHYYGPITARFGAVNDGHFEMPVPSSNSQLDALGTTAIARVLPTNPLSQLTNALIEVRRDGMPDLPGIHALKGRTLKAKNAGSEYLNVEFGWKPLVSDIEKCLYTIKNFHQILDQYRRDSGKLIRRRYDFDEIVVTNTTESVGFQPICGRNIVHSQFVKSVSGPTLKTVKETKKRWFEGVFKFYLPPYGSLAESEALANKLWGTRLTPELVWNAAPWSWLADWFTNSGDLIHNISAFQHDGLVMPWGYMMETCERTITYVCPGLQFWAYPGLKGDAVQSFKGITKRRRVATPYGFGLTFEGFSSRQLAILAALGLSRKGSK